MKKMGFTLSEIIVALSIVAVVAVISAPLITSLIPDKNKVTVLKVNKILTDVTQELLQDPGYYNDGSSMFDSPVLVGDGLAADRRPSLPEFSEDLTPEERMHYVGILKYPYLLATKLSITEEPVSGDDDSTVFTTVDGLQWIINEPTQDTSPYDVQKQGYTYTIAIDINGEDGENATYDDAEGRPDRFAFQVDTRGKVTGADALTRAYLENPHKLNDRQADLARAAEIAEE